MGRLRILDRALGDKSISWDKGKRDEVEVARQEFEFLVKEKGWLAYAVDPSKPDRKGRQVRAFDVNAEELVLVPAMVGG